MQSKLESGVNNMDALAAITALYVALWVGVYGDAVKKDVEKLTTPTQQVQESK